MSEFVPVVTDGMIDVGAAKRSELWATSGDVLLAMTAHLDFQRQLRAYVAEQMRGLVPKWTPCLRFSDCRAETLANIAKWERSND